MAAKGTQGIRFTLYAVAALYLAGDLLVFHGPLRQKIDLANPDSPASIDAAKKRGVLARVSGHSITRSQVERAMSESLWLDGKKLSDLSPQEADTLHESTLQELIDHELLRQLVNVTTPAIEIDQDEIDKRVERFSTRFGNKDSMNKAAKGQGIHSENELRERITDRLRQEKLIESRIAKSVGVTDDEAKAWFDSHSTAMELPERIKVRHIFIATLNTPSEDARGKLQAALTELTEKRKDFATLANELSEDPASKVNGGDMGWMSRHRIPSDFAAPVFSLELNTPTLVRTKLGWHIVEVTEKKASEPASFERVKPEILSSLEAKKRKDAVNAFRESLRKNETVKIELLK